MTSFPHLSLSVQTVLTERSLLPQLDPLPGVDSLPQAGPAHHGAVDERLPLLANASGKARK